MDPFGITVGCVALIGATSRTNVRISEFVDVFQIELPELNKIRKNLKHMKHISELLMLDFAEDPLSASSSTFRHHSEDDTAYDPIKDQINNCLDVLDVVEFVLKAYLNGTLNWALTGKVAIKVLNNVVKDVITALQLTVNTQYWSNLSEIKRKQEKIRTQLDELWQFLRNSDKYVPPKDFGPSELVALCFENGRRLDERYGVDVVGLERMFRMADGTSTHSRSSSCSSSNDDVLSYAWSNDYCPYTPEMTQWLMSIAFPDTHDQKINVPTVIDYSVLPSYNHSIAPMPRSSKYTQIGREKSAEEIRKNFKEMIWASAIKRAKRSNPVAEQFKEMVRMKAGMI